MPQSGAVVLGFATWSKSMLLLSVAAHYAVDDKDFTLPWDAFFLLSIKTPCDK